MNHAEVRARLIDYMEGDLALSKRALVDGHLDQCATCAQELADLRRAVELLRSLPEPEPPAELVPTLMDRIAAGEGRPGLLQRLRLAPLPGSERSARWSTPMTVLAAAAAGALAVWVAPVVRDAVVGPERPPAGSPLAAVRPSPSLVPAAGPSGTAAPGDLRERVTAAAAPLAAGAAAPEPTLAFQPPATAEAEPPALPEVPSPPLPDPARPLTVVAADGMAEVAAPTPSSGPAVPPAIVPEVLQRPVVSGPAPSAEVSPDRQERIDRTRDGWLDWIKAHPEAYVHEYQGYSPGERPNWVRSLAQRAQERGDLAEVIAALRATEQPLAEEIAADFERVTTEDGEVGSGR